MRIGSLKVTVWKSETYLSYTGKQGHELAVPVKVGPFNIIQAKCLSPALLKAVDAKVLIFRSFPVSSSGASSAVAPRWR
jgi:hypothetical protein